MAIRCWWLIGWVIVASGVAPAAPASNGSTNPVVENIQAEAPADQLAAPLLRDPFWPVGYSPVTKTVPVAVSTATAAVASAPVADDLIKQALAMIQVGGIIRRGTKCFATVNGVVVEPGDSIPVMVDDRMMVFIVRSIDLKRIQIEPARK